MFEERDLKEIGISQYGVISPAKIVFDDEIRTMCEKNICRLYGKTWACPPAVGTVSQCRERCLQYKNALVFNSIYPLEDSFDYDGMRRWHAQFKKLCDRLYEIVRLRCTSFLLLSNEGCSRCQVCTYPTAACRMPDKLFPSLEGFGIQVAKLAASAGIHYINGTNTVTYFGMLLY